MGMIARDVIDKIFETAQIEEVIGDFVQLKRSGSSLKGMSPFTNEKTPSFYVIPAKGIFKDFSSGKGGSVVTFLMEHEHFTYPEALRYLAKRYNIEIEEEEQSPEQLKAATQRESLYIVNDFASTYFEDNLWNSKDGKAIGLSYFKERGFSEETIKKFHLGYSSEVRDSFTKSAQSKGYQDEYLEMTGLSIRRENGWIDRFWGRVMFPIQSQSGRVLGFGGRVLRSDAKTAKYLNSPESEIYHKSKILYGIYQSKTAIVKNDKCYLVEGYTDVISLHQAGIENVVSSSGTALTPDQIRLIHRLTENVTILYDGDAAGIRASFRGIDLILEQGLNVRVLLFPDGDDPDSFSRKVGKDELKSYLDANETDFLRFKAEILMKDAQGDPIKKAGMIRDLVQSIAVIPDPITRDVYIRECASIVDMEEKVLFSELSILVEKKEGEKKPAERKPRMEVVSNESESQNIDLKKASEDSLHHVQESAIIWLLLHYGTNEITQFSEEPLEESEGVVDLVATFILEDMINDELSFNNPIFQRIFDEYVQVLNEEKIIVDGQHFVRHPEPEIASVASDMLAERYSLSNWAKKEVFVSDPLLSLPRFVHEALLRLKQVKLDHMIHQLQENFKHLEIPVEDRMQMLHQIKEFTEFRNRINIALNRVL